LKFQITQHSKDEQLMKSFVSYLGCGRYETSQGDCGNYVCTKFSDPLPPPAPEGVGGGGGLMKKSSLFLVNTL
jgi:hypothetical protein